MAGLEDDSRGPENRLVQPSWLRLPRLSKGWQHGRRGGIAPAPCAQLMSTADAPSCCSPRTDITTHTQTSWHTAPFQRGKAAAVAGSQAPYPAPNTKAEQMNSATCYTGRATHVAAAVSVAEGECRTVCHRKLQLSGHVGGRCWRLVRSTSGGGGGGGEGYAAAPDCMWRYCAGRPPRQWQWPRSPCVEARVQSAMRALTGCLRPARPSLAAAASHVPAYAPHSCLPRS